MIGHILLLKNGSIRIYYIKLFLIFIEGGIVNISSEGTPIE